MGNKDLIRSFSKYVSLNILGMLGLSCYILADTFFISNALGPAGLAALNFSIPVYCVINGAGLMLGIGGATKYSVLEAQGDKAGGNRIFTNTLLLGVCLGAIIFASGLLFSEPLARVLGADAVTLEMTNTYLMTIMSFAPCFILNNIFIAFVRNDGSPKLSMAAMLTGSFSNVILDYIFMYPFGMGMFGAAFATGLAPVISLGVLSLHFIRGKNRFRPVRCRLQNVKSILSLGLSSFIAEISSGLVIIVFNLLIIGIEGNTGVAAYGVVANLALVALSVYTGVSQGMQPLVSREYGAGRRENARVILKYSLILAVGVSAFMYCLTFIFSNNLVAVFNGENDLLLAELADAGIKIYFVGFFFAGVNIIASSFFSSMEKPKSAFIISLLRGCVVLVPAAAALAALAGMNGIWMSFVVAELITSAVSLTFILKSGRKKRSDNAL